MTANSLIPLATTQTLAVHVQAYRNAAYTFVSAPNTPVVFPFDTEIIDNFSAFNTGTATFTAPVGGMYLVTARLGLSATNLNGLVVAKNGLAYDNNNANAWGNSSGTVADIVPCSVGDTLAVGYYTSTSGATATTGSSTCYLYICQLA